MEQDNIEQENSVQVFFASDIAEGYLQDTAHKSEAEESEFRALIFAVGEFLYEEGCPGEWENFSPEAFFKCLEPSPARRVEAAMRLIAIYGWLACCEIVSLQRAKKITQDIGIYAPQAAPLLSFVYSSVKLYQEMEEEENEGTGSLAN